MAAEVKAFIPVDSVEEVIRANRALAQGLDQIQSIRAWWNRHAWAQVAGTLGIEGAAEPYRVQFAVIGNGFAGSDYIAVPKGVVIADAHFLLRPEFRTTSAIEAIDNFEKRLVDEMRSPTLPRRYETLLMGGITFEVQGQAFG